MSHFLCSWAYIEVRRLDEDITRESLISLSDPREGACCITVAVEGVLMLPKVSNEFGFKDQTSEEGFVEGLKAELEAVNNFHHPLPLTSQLIQRVIDCMEEHIASGRTPRRLFESIYHDGSVDDAQQAGAGEGSSSSSAEAEAAAEEAAVAAVAAAVAAQKPAERQRTRFWRENLHQGITDAIGRANQQNPQGATFDQVVDMLRQNPSIEFDEEVRSIAYERFLGAVYFPDTPVDQSKCGQQ
uniref:Uncharacterized protein n=1 Tax=Kalanchoe fedtschenkoi TaxID=63787 RepID=A0A7N0U118_KALFE